MFRIEFFVEDKHLPDVLRALTSRAMNLKFVPVVNAVKEEDKPARGRPRKKQRAAAKTHHREVKFRQAAATSLEAFVRELKTHPEINKHSAVDAAHKAGFASASYGYFLKTAIKAGLIKASGTTQKRVYTWTGKEI